jgi:hypothetical protein
VCHLAQAGVLCPDLVNTTMNFLVPYNSKFFFFLILAIILKARILLTEGKVKGKIVPVLT